MGPLGRQSGLPSLVYLPARRVKGRHGVVDQEKRRRLQRGARRDLSEESRYSVDCFVTAYGRYCPSRTEESARRLGRRSDRWPRAGERTTGAGIARDCDADATTFQRFTTISHEARTPLSCILGLSNLLLGDHEHREPQCVNSVQTITSSGDLLLEVVNDILGYSKVSCGQVELSMEPALSD